MSAKNTVTKSLPKTGEEIEITIESTGDDGGDVEIAIEPPGPHDVSDQTKEEYSDHYWIGAGKFWPDTLNEAVENHEVKSHTYKSNSGNVSLTSCYIQIDYFEEANIEGAVETLLTTLDQAIMAEEKRQEAIDESTEAAQQVVCDDITSRIENIELE